MEAPGSWALFSFLPTKQILVKNEVLFKILGVPTYFFPPQHNKPETETNIPGGLSPSHKICPYLRGFREQRQPGEFVSKAFMLLMGAIRSLSINGVGTGVKDGRTIKRKRQTSHVKSKPRNQNNWFVKFYILLPTSYALTVLKYCHRVPGMPQRRTLERGVSELGSF